MDQFKGYLPKFTTLLAKKLRFAVLCGLIGGVSLSGCNALQSTTLSIPSIPLDKNTPLSNPLSVPSQDTDFVWSQIIDTVEDYFDRNRSEIRPMRDSMQWVEGRLETHPQISATYLEPWRKDALDGFQRLQSSFQTMRRTAIVRVVPTPDGFQIGVEVIKEIEEVDRSLLSGDGAPAARHDGTIVRTDSALLGQPLTLDWIRQENDTDLEQRILREILGRTTNVRQPRSRFMDFFNSPPPPR